MWRGQQLLRVPAEAHRWGFWISARSREAGVARILPVFEIALVLVRLDHVALTDLTHFRIFPRNLEPDFTHYLCEQRKENGNL